jgi:hypothetical protein
LEPFKSRLPSPQPGKAKHFAASALGESPTRLRQFKYVLILRRVGAQWQIHYDIWNGSYKSKE